MTNSDNLFDLEEAKISIQKRAQEHNFITKAYIFGSRARNDYRPDSDLDIAIEIKKLPGDADEFTTYCNEKAFLENSLQNYFNIKIHLEWIDFNTNMTPTVLQGIQQSSKLIFEKNI